MKKTVVQPKPPKNLKGRWIVVFPTGKVADWSLAYTRKQAIKKYLDEQPWIKDRDAYWKERSKQGTRCIKVNITFQIAEK